MDTPGFLCIITLSALFSLFLSAHGSFNVARRPPSIVTQPGMNMNATPTSDNKLFFPNNLSSGSFSYFRSAKAFSTLQLPCVVNSHPVSRVYWLYNDSFLPNGDPISVITSENSATLIFKQTDSKFIEPGKYQCAAELQVSADPNSPIWRVMSDPVMLIPIEIPTGDQLASELLTVEQYKPLTLTPIQPMPKYLGKLDNVGWMMKIPGRINPTVFDLPSWVTLDDQNGLNFAFLDKSVEKDYSFYPTYLFKNPVTESEYTTFKGYKLTFNTGNVAYSKLTAYRVSGSGSETPNSNQVYTKIVQQGERAVLFCYFTGYFTNDLASNPWPVAVEWEYLSGDRNQQSVSSPKLKKMAGSLIFEEVDWSDEQTYGCTARATCLGSEDCARPLGPYKIKMMVKSAPIWVIPPKTIVEIASTESLTLNFTVRARPEATFKFSFQKNADTIEKIDSSGPENARFKLSAPLEWQEVFFSQNVTIATTTPYAESGVLIVDVSNAMGSVRAYVSVLVFKKTRITSAPVTDGNKQLQYGGGELKWKVEAEGEPMFANLTASWFHKPTGQTELKPLAHTPGQFEISPDGFTFKIVEPKDANMVCGDYHVVVSNGHDSDQRTITLIPAPATAMILIWLVAALVLVFLLILLVLFALLIVRLCKKTSDTYEVGAEEEAIGHNPKQEFMQEQNNREYVRQTSGSQEPVELEPLDPNPQKDPQALYENPQKDPQAPGRLEA